MNGEIENLRIHFYGVQGSGAVFPHKRERDQIRQASDIELLKKAFSQLYVDLENKLLDKANSSNSCEAVLEHVKQLNKAESLAQYYQDLNSNEPTIYGGWTTCVHIETADGYDIVIDCGSGFRLCVQDLNKKWASKPHRELHILGTHAHFDHTEGFDQSGICFDPRNHVHFYANRSYLMSIDRHLGIFSKQGKRSDEGRPTPLNFEMMPASFESTEIRDIHADGAEPNKLVNQYHDIHTPIKIGKTSIQAFPVFHPDPCIAYRIEHNGKVFVFCTDHELRRGNDPYFALQVESVKAENRLIKHSLDADVLYRDGQFLRDEYDALKPLGGDTPAPRKDWGHSCIEDVVEMAKEARVKRTYIGHHDPSRSWQEMIEIDQSLKQQSKDAGLHFELAKAETIIDL